MVSAHGAGRGRLSTHVLDLARGAPAAGVAVELRRLYSDGSGEILEVMRTNADGRTDEPLREAGKLERGTYELVFSLGDYLRDRRARTAARCSSTRCRCASESASPTSTTTCRCCSPRSHTRSIAGADRRGRPHRLGRARHGALRRAGRDQRGARPADAALRHPGHGAGQRARGRVDARGRDGSAHRRGRQPRRPLPRGRPARRRATAGLAPRHGARRRRLRRAARRARRRGLRGAAAPGRAAVAVRHRCRRLRR